jgi:hypothetical protein
VTQYFEDVNDSVETELFPDEEVEIIEEVLPGRKTFSDYLKEVVANMELETVNIEEDPADKVFNVGNIITLLKGDRVISKEYSIAPHVDVRFASLTAAHKEVISAFCINKEKENEDGSPFIDQKMNYDFSLALMWHSLNGVVFPDPLVEARAAKKMVNLWDDVADRSAVFHQWPSSWLSTFTESAQDFVDQLKATCSETNLKGF